MLRAFAFPLISHRESSLYLDHSFRIDSQLNVQKAVSWHDGNRKTVLEPDVVASASAASRGCFHLQ